MKNKTSQLKTEGATVEASHLTCRSNANTADSNASRQAKVWTWKKYECGNGNRWVSAHRWLDNDGEICSFSGCNCGTPVKVVGVTHDQTEAANWFRNVKFQEAA